MLIALTALMLLTGCNDNTPEPSQAPMYNSPSVSGDVDSLPDTTPSTSAAPDVSDTGDTEAANFKEAVYFTDFQGVTITEETPESANSPFSNVFVGNKVYIITYDKETDSTYYVNYANNAEHPEEKDCYIYSYKGGKRELLVAMPANYLNYRDGVIYFLSNDSVYDLYGHDDKHFYYPSGKLYAYNIAKDTVALLLDENVGELSVVGEYLYFRKTTAQNGTDAAEEYSRMKIGDSTAENMGDYLPVFYGEYQLRFAESEEGNDHRALELVSSEEVIPLTGAGFYNASYGGRTFCISGDIFWFRGKIDGKWHLISIDLTNGERKLYPNTSHYVVTDNGALFAIVPGKYDANEIQIYSEAIDEFEPIIQTFAEKTLYHGIYYEGGYVYIVAEENGDDYEYSDTVLFRLLPVNGEENTYDAEEISG